MLRAFDIYELWKRGRDTARIADLLNVKESEVYNMLNVARHLLDEAAVLPCDVEPRKEWSS